MCVWRVACGPDLVPPLPPRQMTLFLRVPRAVSATLTARIVFATRHTCGNGDANEADSAGESAGPEDVPADMAWPDIIRSQPHLSRRTSTSVRFTSITPLQASYEVCGAVGVSVVCGLWSVICDLWSVVCGLWL